LKSGASNTALAMAEAKIRPVEGKKNVLITSAVSLANALPQRGWELADMASSAAIREQRAAFG